MISSLKLEECEEFSSVIFSDRLVEPKIDKTASEYISKNFKKLVAYVRSIDAVDKNKCEDLVNDVAVSILRGEQFGEGYKMCYMTNEHDTPISVEQFVFGRIKKYANNRKYRKATTSKIMERTTERINLIPADSNTEDLDLMTREQKAYALASTEVHELDDVDSKESIDEEIDYLLSLDGETGGRLSRLLFKLDDLKQFIKNNANCDSNISDVFRVVNCSDDVKEALTDVIMYSRGREDEISRKVAERMHKSWG